MASNTGTTVQSNVTFTTGVVPLAVGVLNPANSPQSVWDCGVGFNYAAYTSVITGAPATSTVVLEGTYDGNTWTTIATGNSTTGDTEVLSSGSVFFTNLRARCTATTGGTNPTINVFVTASQTPMTVTTTSGTLPVAGGSINSVTNLNAATTTVTGTVTDQGSAHQTPTFQVVTSAGTTAGAVTFFGSVDNVTFVPLTSAAIQGSTGAPTITNGVMSFTAQSTALVSLGANHAAMRFLRADVTTNMVGGTVTVKSTGA